MRMLLCMFGVSKVGITSNVEIRKRAGLTNASDNISPWDFSTETFGNLQHFTCLMYAPTTKTVVVNQLRHDLFFAKRGVVESNHLPPCEDTLTKHAMRANYQAGVCKRCLEKQPTIPDPEGHGWKKDETGILGLAWMEGKPHQML